MRRALILLLAILTLAGPGLCCCTLPSADSSPSEVPSCCHSPADEEHPSAPCKDQCPCWELRETPATISEVSPVFLPAPAGEWLVWDVVVPLPGVLSSVGAAGPAPPFLSAERLLHVHHRLRC